MQEGQEQFFKETRPLAEFLDTFAEKQDAMSIAVLGGRCASSGSREAGLPWLSQEGHLVFKNTF